MHLEASVSKVGKNGSKEHLHSSYMIHKWQEYVFEAFGLHSTSLGWSEQNLIYDHQLVASGAWNHVGALVFALCSVFPCKSVFLNLSLGYRTNTTANFLLKITLERERQLNVNWANTVFLGASRPRLRHNSRCFTSLGQVVHEFLKTMAPLSKTSIIQDR